MDPVSVPRSRARLMAVVALVLGVALGASVLRLSDGSGADDGGLRLSEGQRASGSPTAPPTTPPTEPGAPTRFTLSSLNVLGAGHTGPNGRKRGWATGPERMTWLAGLIDRRGVDVIGLQEFEAPQYKVFVSQLGTKFATYPGTAWGAKTMRNSVAWRLDSWELVSASSFKIPYFHGIMRRMPLVLLRNLQTGQQAYFTSLHNPANARGPAEKWRDRATDIEIAMVNNLRETTGLPVYVTGDANEKDEFFCRMTAKTDMVSANGGSNKGSGNAWGCRPTRPTYIDWVFGSPETTFSGYYALRNSLVRKSTDHPMLVAEAELPPVVIPPECPPTPTASPSRA